MSAEGLDNDDYLENEKSSEGEESVPNTYEKQLERDVHIEKIVEGYKEFALKSLKIIEELMPRLDKIEEEIRDLKKSHEKQLSEAGIRGQEINSNVASAKDYKNILIKIISRSENWSGILKCLVENKFSRTSELVRYAKYKGKTPDFQVWRAIKIINERFAKETEDEMIMTIGSNQNKYFIKDKYIKNVAEALAELKV